MSERLNPRCELSVNRLLVLCCTFALLWLSAIAQPAHAQTYTVLHRFTGTDGAIPFGGVVLDAGGNMYGMTWQGGNFNFGVLYQLKHAGTGYITNVLHNFTGTYEGASPHGGGLFAREGALYGYTTAGGIVACAASGYFSCGVVFSARPPGTICHSTSCPWSLTPIYSFQGASDGDNPYFGEVAFDAAGNIYGTSSDGGQFNGGTVWKLTRSGDHWTETILHSFGSGSDGKKPVHGVILDSLGNLYGTTNEGGTYHYGTVFELSPSGGGWTESVLANFSTAGAIGGYLQAGLVRDAAGNLYGATSVGTSTDTAVFQLSPSAGGWQLNVLQTFPANQSVGVVGNMVFDSQGNLYGVTMNVGAGQHGMIFKLAPGSGGWTFTDLHDFFGADGGDPTGDLVMDAAGNLYGTTSDGGGTNDCPGGCGVIWELTP